VLRMAEAAFEAELLSAGGLPQDLGRTLRGGFGKALREISCVEPSAACPACPLAKQCAYGYLFETPVPSDAQVMRKYTHAPHPLVLRVEGLPSGPELRHGGLRIHVGLVGRAAAYSPNVLLALQALGRMGVGPRRLPFALRALVDESTRARTRLSGHASPVRPPEPVEYPIVLGARAQEAVRIRIETPLRIVANGALVRRLDFGRLVSASLRRIELLWRVYGDDAGGEWSLDSAALVALADGVETLSDQTRWVETDRFSRRQGREHPMGGLLGELAFGAEAGLFIPILRLAGRVHIGKHTVFGHGHCVVSTGVSAEPHVNGRSSGAQGREDRR